MMHNNYYVCNFSLIQIYQGELAQLVERVLSMHEVAGSIPAFSTIKLLHLCLLHILMSSQPIMWIF